MEKKEKKSFEDNLNELETIVKELEQGDVPLDEAITKFNQAMNLAKDCSKTIDEATKTVSKILNENNEFKDFKIEE